MRQKNNTEEIHMNMKKIIVYFCFNDKETHSQKSMFSKDPIINLENFQKQKSIWVFLRV
jgi:phage-related tail protein